MSGYLEGIEGDFPLHHEVVSVLPTGTKAISAESWGRSAGAKTARIATQLPSGQERCVQLGSHVPDFGPKPVGKGDYHDEMGNYTHFYVMEYHDMDHQSPPESAVLAKLDNTVNEAWPEYDDACKQLIDHVISRLLGALQSYGRNIEPVLCHGDLWEGNVATDFETGKIVIFDPGESMYAHNEIEFGTWRCIWATHFTSPEYASAYQRLIPPSEPVEDWDDRNRLYAIKCAICDSAGHVGSKSRIMVTTGRAFNDMLYLCEKYAPPLESLEKYDPDKDISVTGKREVYDVMAGARRSL
ncbi:hypothetical protein PG996_001469 [Apiospora saccharicola]|uniref:protein-ribulosamine 3-kinase n=1 Tax=Apiospora saccharicola TaxID=335842 RepID=A0ABR1WGW0_9PEZI